MKVFEAFLVAPSSKALAAPIASMRNSSNNVLQVHPWEPFWAFEFQKRPKRNLFLHMELLLSNEHLQIKSASPNISCENNGNQIIGGFLNIKLAKKNHNFFCKKWDILSSGY